VAWSKARRVATRGTVHDPGRAITHKRIIIRLYLKGYLTPEIARRTKHSDEHAIGISVLLIRFVCSRIER